MHACIDEYKLITNCTGKINTKCIWLHARDILQLQINPNVQKSVHAALLDAEVCQTKINR